MFMNAANAFLTKLTDWLLALFIDWPLAGLLFWAVVAGVVMTIAFGITSHQGALAQISDRTRAQLLAIRLFRDDLAVTFRCQIELLKATGLRLFHSLLPMFVMLIPFVIVLVQLAQRYQVQPLRPGDSAIVEIKLADDHWEEHQDVHLAQPAGVTVETEGLRDDEQRTVSWRIRAVEADQPVRLKWELGDETVEKTLTITDDVKRLALVSPRRPGPGILDRLLYPAEPGLAADSIVQGVDVVYPHARSTPVMGIDIPWWATFLIVSMLTAFAVKPFFRVHF